MDLNLRPLPTDDIPILARHLAAVEAVDQTGEHYNEDDLAEEFANPDIEIGKEHGARIGGYTVRFARQDGAD